MPGSGLSVPITIPVAMRSGSLVADVAGYCVSHARSLAVWRSWRHHVTNIAVQVYSDIRINDNPIGAVPQS